MKKYFCDHAGATWLQWADCSTGPRARLALPGKRLAPIHRMGRLWNPWLVRDGLVCFHRYAFLPITSSGNQIALYTGGLMFAPEGRADIPQACGHGILRSINLSATAVATCPEILISKTATSICSVAARRTAAFKFSIGPTTEYPRSPRKFSIVIPMMGSSSTTSTLMGLADCMVRLHRKNRWPRCQWMKW